MDQDFIQQLVANGPFAVLFVWLLMYVMKSNKEREVRLQDLLEKFSEKYDVIITEIREIKKELTDKEK